MMGWKQVATHCDEGGFATHCDRGGVGGKILLNHSVKGFKWQKFPLLEEVL